MYQTHQQYCNNRKQYLFNWFTILYSFPYSISHYYTIYWYTLLNKIYIISFNKTFKFWQDKIHVHDFFHVFNNSIIQLPKIVY